MAALPVECTWESHRNGNRPDGHRLTGAAKLATQISRTVRGQMPPSTGMRGQPIEFADWAVRALLISLVLLPWGGGGLARGRRPSGCLCPGAHAGGGPDGRAGRLVEPRGLHELPGRAGEPPRGGGGRGLRVRGKREGEHKGGGGPRTRVCAHAPACLGAAAPPPARSRLSRLLTHGPPLLS